MSLARPQTSAARIPTQERLIIALDVANAAEAQRLVQSIGDAAVIYKVGLQLFTAEGPQLVKDIVSSGKKVFLDLKLHDIPNTVAGAVKSITGLGCSFLTVHTSGGSKMLKAAVDAAAPNPLMILGVTVLTSLDDSDLAEVGQPAAREQVLRLARLALRAGCGGIVASPQEVSELRGALGETMRIVAPGIRPSGSASDDQARTATPADAIRSGADYLVVGRPITQHAEPVAATRAMLREIESA